MKKLMMLKMQGLKKTIAKFAKKIEKMDPGSGKFGEFMDVVLDEMKGIAFDDVTRDGAGNIVGTVKGYGSGDAVVMISHVDVMPGSRHELEGLNARGMARFKYGVIANLYSAALIKRTLLPLTGDLVVCCVPRFECCDPGVKYLFDNFLKNRTNKIKGVVLCEPTGFNVNIGHKGRMEYEIVVKGKLKKNFLENRGMNMLGTMFPLISELEKVSKDLPNNVNMGRSGLRIKDVLYRGYNARDDMNEFRVVVDRIFVPDESEGAILTKAKTIARKVYSSESEITVRTMLSKERLKTHTGLEMVSEKEFKPWIMESHKPFAVESLKCLTENGFKSNFGFWRSIVTEGSYTCADLKIPTIGFGAGEEDDIYSGEEKFSLDKIERAVYGQSLIVQRNIGMPTFGWTSDSI